MAGQFFRLTCPGRAENVGLCRLAVATFAANLGFTIADIEELKVAVSEAVTNVVVHAYPDAEGEGLLHVECEQTQDGIAVVVRDDGVGIADLNKAREPSYTTRPEHMGLGFVFMESFADELLVDSAVGKGTRVEMRKRREAVAAES